MFRSLRERDDSRRGSWERGWVWNSENSTKFGNQWKPNHLLSFTSLLLNSEPSTSKKQKLTSGKEEPPLTNAIRSFPDEVQLCLSSLPGAIYGVCAKEHIPLGTWIGPYEGRRIPPQHNMPDIDSSYLWEVGFVGVLISQMPRKNLRITHFSTRSWPKIRYFKTVFCTSTSIVICTTQISREDYSLLVISSKHTLPCGWISLHIATLPFIP